MGALKILSASEEYDALVASGASEEELEEYRTFQMDAMRASGASDSEIKKEWGVSEPNVEPIKNYWQKTIQTLKEVKEGAVGKDFEFTEYLESGYNKSIINLVTQYHSDGELPAEFYEGEKEDTGWLERYIDSMANIVPDLPAYLLGAVVTGAITRSPTASAFGAGFVPGTIRETYIQALIDGDVDTFGEWSELFIKHGIKEGVKEGIVLASAYKAQKAVKNPFGKFATLVGTFTAVGSALEGRMPTKEEIVNNTLVLGTLGFGPKAIGKVFDVVKKDPNAKPIDTVDEVLSNKRLEEDVRSENIDKPRDKIDFTKKDDKSAKDQSGKPEVTEKDKVPPKYDVEDIVSETKPKTEKPVIEKVFFDKPLEKVSEKELFERFDQLSKIVDKAEKPTETLTPELKKILKEEGGGSEAFSRKRGYTEKEIAEYKEYKEIAMELDRRLGPDTAITREFDLQTAKEKGQKIKEKEIVDTSPEFKKVEKAEKAAIKKQTEAEKQLKVLEEKIQLETKKEKVTKLEETVKKQKEKVEQLKTKADQAKQNKQDYLNQRTEKPVETEIVEPEVTVESALKNAESIVKFDMPSIALREKITYASDYLKAHFLDRLYPVFKTVREAGEREGYKDKEGQQQISAYKLLRILRGASAGRARHFLSHGTLNFKNLEIVGKPLTEILRPIKDLDTWKNFSYYMVARRTLELAKRAIPTNMTVADAKVLVDYYSKQKMEYEPSYWKKRLQDKEKVETTYEKMAEELFQYQVELITYLKDSGIIDQKMFDVMIELNKDYVPFYRVLLEVKPGTKIVKVEKDGKKEWQVQAEGNVLAKFEISKLNPLKNSKEQKKAAEKWLRENYKIDSKTGLGQTVRNPIKRIKGSEKDIIDPIESIFKNTLHFINLAEQNNAALKWVEMIERHPDLFPHIQKSVAPSKGLKVTLKELENVVSDTSKIDSKVLKDDGFSIFRRDSITPTPTEIVIYRNGKREVWNVGKEIANTFRNLDKKQMHWLVKIMNLQTRTLRAGATLAPDFFVRNITRDTVMAGILSEHGFIPFIHTAQGVWALTTNKAAREKFLRSGAVQSMLVSFDRQYFDPEIKTELLGRNLRQQIQNPLEVLRILSEMFESSSRYGEMKLAEAEGIKKGYTGRALQEYIGYSTRDVTIDFGKMGLQVESLNLISAFYNARLQGYAKIFEGFRDRPGQTTAKIGAYIVTPSILLWIANRDNETYKELPQWQKDMFWIVITGEGAEEKVWRIPKPFELGILFGTGSERTLDWLAANEPDELERIIKTTMKDVGKGAIPWPDTMKTLVEQGANHSFFKQRPIVSRTNEKYLPEYQFGEYTSETSKLLGRGISHIFGNTTTAASPDRIEHVILAWGGTLGRYVLQLTDYMLIQSGKVPEPQTPFDQDALENLPVIKAFMIRNPNANSQYIQQFYNELDTVKKLQNTITRAEESGDWQTANKLYDQLNSVDVDYLLDIEKVLSEQRRMIRDLSFISNDVMSRAEKSHYTDDIYRYMIDEAKAGMDEINYSKQLNREQEKSLFNPLVQEPIIEERGMVQ